MVTAHLGSHYVARPMRLGVKRSPLRRTFEVIAWADGVICSDVRVDGVPVPEFKRRGEAYAWAEAHGLGLAYWDGAGRAWRRLDRATEVHATPRA